MTATHVYLTKQHAVAYVSKHFGDRGIRPAVHSARYDDKLSKDCACDAVDVVFSFGSAEYCGTVCFEHDGTPCFFEY